jgi:hypothetical protein
MADLPVASDQGAQPVVINDPVTAANVANVSALGDLHVQSKTEDGSGNAISSTVDSATSSRNLDVIRPDIMVSGSLGALNATVTGVQQNIGSAVFVASGTWVGTIVAEGSADSGVTWTLLSIASVPGGALSTAGITTNGQYRIAVLGGYNQVRLRMSAYTSGSASIVLNLSGVVAYPLCFQPNAANFNATVRLDDGSGNPITSSTVGSKQPLDVNIIQNASVTPSADNIAALVIANQVYTVSTSINMTSSGVENPILLITNPGANTKILYIYSLSLGLILANNAADFEIYADPTVTTNGTLQTPQSNYVGGGAPASVMNIYTLPTVSSNGTEMGDFFYGQNQNSINFLANLSIIIKPGHSILLTGNPINSNNRPANVTLTWVEQ